MPTNASRPPRGSVNQIPPSRLTTTSLGLFNSRSPKCDASTVSLPSRSRRVSRLVACSQMTRLAARSNARPLAMLLGVRNAVTPPVSSQRWITSEAMSLNSRQCAWGSHAGPSPNCNPLANSTRGTPSSTIDPPSTSDTTCSPISPSTHSPRVIAAARPRARSRSIIYDRASTWSAEKSSAQPRRTCDWPATNSESRPSPQPKTPAGCASFSRRGASRQQRPCRASLRRSHGILSCSDGGMRCSDRCCSTAPCPSAIASS